MIRNLYVFKATSLHDANVAHYCGVVASSQDGAYWWLTANPAIKPEFSMQHVDTYRNWNAAAMLVEVQNRFPRIMLDAVPAGLLVRIYEAKGQENASNGGLSATHVRAVLFGADIPQVAEASPTAPPIELQTRGNLSFAVPTLPYGGSEQTCGPMFGGCWVFAHDGRFPSKQPLPLWDRYETPEQYDMMSR